MEIGYPTWKLGLLLKRALVGGVAPFASPDWDLGG